MQGYILGQLLFLLFINDLPNCLKSSKSILYADDTTLFNNNKDVKSLCNTLKSELCSVVKLNFNLFFFHT